MLSRFPVRSLSNFLRSGVHTTRNFAQNNSSTFIITTASKSLLKVKPVSLCNQIRLSSNGNGDTKRKIVGYWLAGCGCMVLGAVVLGGVTRLTKSGLSMVTWKMFGEKLPRTEQEWHEEFERYQQFPEYKMLNNEMTLHEFKWIWYMEFIHRTWGRFIGATFYLPATYFWYNGYFHAAMKPKILLMGGLILAQGLMGWYMVKSGLEDRFESQSDVPRVSSYRLASHLSLALILYSLYVRSAMDHLIPAQSVTKNLRNLRVFAPIVAGTVFLTAISGAFVAGSEGALVYNSFPKMADKWMPDDYFALTPVYRNFFENPSATQWDHRVLGSSTTALVTLLWLVARPRRHLMPKRAWYALNALLGVVWMQATLGVSTLLYYKPTWLAASHQSGSLALLSSALWFAHELKKIPK